MPETFTAADFESRTFSEADFQPQPFTDADFEQPKTLPQVLAEPDIPVPQFGNPQIPEAAPKSIAELAPMTRATRKEQLLKERAEAVKVRELTENQESFLNALELIVEPFTASGMLNQPARITGQPDPYKANVPIVPPEVALKAIEFASVETPSEGSARQGLQKLAANVAASLTTPEGVVTLPAATASSLIRAAFGGQMAYHLPGQVEHAAKVLTDPASTPAEQVVAAGEPTVATAMITALAKAPLLAPKTAAAVKEITKGEPSPVQERAAAPEVAPAAEGEMALGIAPPGTSIAQRIIEFFKPPPESTSPPPINPDTSTPLPDFQPKAVANEIFSQPFAVERIPIIGRLFGGRARIRNEKDQAVAAWYSERHGIGPAVASAVGEQIKGKINSVFKADESGNLNVVPTTEGQSLKISDVFEGLQKNPDSYALTPEQRTVFDETMRPILDRQRELVEQYDLIEGLEGDASYFQRIVTERPVEDAGKLGGGRRVGAKQFFQKERAFETEAEGWEKGYEYERDVEKRLVTGVERLYRAMADKRLADDPVLEGKTRDSVMSELREAYSEELGSGEMTEAKLERIANGLQSKGTVYEPGFFGKIFDAETANMLNREFSREQSHILRAIANTNDFLKAIRLGFDVGVGQIQLLPTLYRNPGIWAKAQWKSLQAMFRPEVFSEYARQNESVISEMAQMGSGIGRLPEMLAGMTGPTISRVPGLKQAAAPFARQFQTALDVAKVELWKAWREVTPKEEWSKVIQTIESQLQSARMESTMVPHSRALAERVALLAPSYYRGAVNLIAAMGERGVSGKVARQTMGSFIAGSTALFVGVAYLSGMSEDEIQKRLNPTSSNFMLWRIKSGERYINIGPGGIFRSFLRLAGNVAKTSIEHPENWKSLSPDKNPLSRWYRGHAGPAVGLGWDQFTGRDFLGEKTDMEKLPGTIAPLWMQELVSRQQGQPPVTGVELAASFGGLQTFPESQRQQYQAERDELAKSKFGKDFSDLRLRDQVAITKEMNKRPSFAVKPQVSQRIMELSMEAQAQREKRLSDSIKETELIKSSGLRMRGYDPVLTVGGTRFPLSQRQQERYEQLIVSEYDKGIERFVKSPAFKKSGEARQKLFDARLEEARARAKSKLIQELNK